MKKSKEQMQEYLCLGKNKTAFQKDIRTSSLLGAFFLVLNWVISKFSIGFGIAAIGMVILFIGISTYFRKKSEEKAGYCLKYQVFKMGFLSFLFLLIGLQCILFYGLNRARIIALIGILAVYIITMAYCFKHVSKKAQGSLKVELDNDPAKSEFWAMFIGPSAACGCFMARPIAQSVSVSEEVTLISIALIFFILSFVFLACVERSEYYYMVWKKEQTGVSD